MQEIGEALFVVETLDQFRRTNKQFTYHTLLNEW